MSRAAVLADRLADERGREVVFVSHCLLNENARYLGGAFHRGAVPEIVDLLRGGVGVVQMPCPEQRAWGGVLKRRLLLGYGLRERPALYRLRGALFRLFVWQTRLRYRRLARGVARDIEDCRRSGIAVLAIVGVGGSPSCGVATTLDMRRSFEVLAACPLARLDRTTVNEDAVAGCAIAGEGLFTHELRRRTAGVPYVEYDLIAEMRGRPQPEALRRLAAGPPRAPTTPGSSPAPGPPPAAPR